MGHKQNEGQDKHSKKQQQQQPEKGSPNAKVT